MATKRPANDDESSSPPAKRISRASFQMRRIVLVVINMYCSIYSLCELYVP